MECIWRLFSHRQPDGYCHQQDPAVFYVRLCTHDGFPDHYLHGAGLLEKYAEVYVGREAKSLVLFVNGQLSMVNCEWSMLTHMGNGEL